MPVFLFAVAVLFTIGQLSIKHQWHIPKSIEVFLSYILLFNVGVMGILGAYMHIFMAPATAEMIGWKPGSPFQFEIGVANFSYGILGLLAFRLRDHFWDACIIGWSIFLLGCFIGHVIDYFTQHNTAPYNIGPFIWFYDLILPIFVLALLGYLRCTNRATPI